VKRSVMCSRARQQGVCVIVARAPFVVRRPRTHLRKKVYLNATVSVSVIRAVLGSHSTINWPVLVIAYRVPGPGDARLSTERLS